MAKSLDPKDTATFEEVLMSNVYTQEAIINLMKKKGLMTRKEILDEIVSLRKKV